MMPLAVSAAAAGPERALLLLDEVSTAGVDILLVEWVCGQQHMSVTESEPGNMFQQKRRDRGTNVVFAPWGFFSSLAVR